MMLTTLRAALNHMRYDLKVVKDIGNYLKEGKTLEDYLKQKTVEFSGFNVDEPWWLEKFFKRLRIPFVVGAFLVYFVIIIPDIFFSYAISGSNNTLWVYHQLFALPRDILFITVPLILMNQSYQKIKKLKHSLNEYARKELFKTPVYSDKINNEQIEKTDKYFFENYIKPISFKSLQNGFDLSHKKSYCFGCAIISGAVAVFLFLQFQLPLLQPPLDAPLLDLWKTYVYIKFFIFWAILGMLTWSAYVALNIAFYCGYYVVDFIPQKPLKHYYQPIFNLGSIFWITGSIVILIHLPSIYVDPIVFSGLYHNNTTLVKANENFVLVWLGFVMVSLTIGVVMIFSGLRSGMSASKYRKMMILESKLAELKSGLDAGEQKVTSQYAILLNDYKDLISNHDSPANSANVTKTIAALVGPPLSIMPQVLRL